MANPDIIGADSLDVSASSADTIGFSNPEGLLQIERAALGADSLHTFENAITGFGIGDTIDVQGIPTIEAASYNATTGDLTLSHGGGTVDATLHIGLGYDIGSGDDTLTIAANAAHNGVVIGLETPATTISTEHGNPSRSSSWLIPSAAVRACSAAYR